MINTKDLVALTEHLVSWTLIRVKNWDKKIAGDMHSWIWFYFLMKLGLLQVMLTLSNYLKRLVLTRNWFSCMVKLAKAHSRTLSHLRLGFLQQLVMVESCKWLHLMGLLPIDFWSFAEHQSCQTPPDARFF